MKANIRKILKNVSEIFLLDARSLALLRIGLGTLILIDLFQRARYLETHYTDFGILPRDVLLKHFHLLDTFSLHLLSGRMWVIVSLFIFQALVALSLLIGFKTRLSTVVSWILLLSLHNRNTLILQGGDVLFRMLLFWSIFLPLGKRFSVDHYLTRYRTDPTRNDVNSNRLITVASFALVMQAIILYAVAASHKISKQWLRDFDALYYALNADHFATDIGVFLREFESILPFLTIVAFAIEATIPLLLLSPFFSQHCRLAAVKLIFALHLGIGLTLHVGLFWLIDLVFALALIPPLAWARLNNILPNLNIETTIYQKLDVFLNRSKLRAIEVFKERAIQVSRVFVAVFLIGNVFYICAWVAPYIYKEFKFPSKYTWYGRFLGFDQRWQMFSPQPMRDDGWLVISGVLKDGSPVEVLSGREGEVTFDKPPHLSRAFVTQRWRKYFRQLLAQKKKPAMMNFAKAICRRWNREEPLEDKKLEQFEIFYVLELTRPQPEKPRIEKRSRWLHFCYEVPKDLAERKKKIIDAALTAEKDKKSAQVESLSPEPSSK